jgi:multidrug resistance efflux pump
MAADNTLTAQEAQAALAERQRQLEEKEIVIKRQEAIIQQRDDDLNQEREERRREAQRAEGLAAEIALKGWDLFYPNQRCLAY